MKGVIEMDVRALIGAFGKAFGVAALFTIIYLFLRNHPNWDIGEGENFVLFFQILLGTVLVGLLSAAAFTKVSTDWEAVKEARLRFSEVSVLGEKAEARKAFERATARTLHPAFKIVLAASYVYLSLGGAMLVKAPLAVAIPGILFGVTLLWFVFLIIIDLAGYFDGIWYVLPLEKES